MLRIAQRTSLGSRLAQMIPSLFLFAFSVHGAHAQLALAWKLEPGQTLRYRFTHHSESKVKVEAQEQDQVYTQVVDYSWKCTEARPDGTFKLAQKVERVKVDIENGDQTLRYDSETGIAQGEGSADLKTLYEAVLGTPFDLTLTPDGSIVEALAPRSVIETVLRTGVAAQVDGG